MPIPFLLGALGIGAAALGVGGHLTAKETNEEAERLARKAKRIYNESKESLERSQKSVEEALLSYGNLKKDVLEKSLSDACDILNRVINTEKKKNNNDIKPKLAFDKQKMLEIQKMVNIHKSTFSSGIAGATAGAVISLAASGMLPVAGGLISTAGSMLAMGEVGLAAGLFSTALSFTPLSAIAAPVVLFTGISSSIKADENLEKAQTMYAESEDAVEKMKVSETLCTAITEKTYMFHNLLSEMNAVFSKCVKNVCDIVEYWSNLLDSNEIEFDYLTEQEQKLCAVTFALAFAIHTIIDTPLLTKDGKIEPKLQDNYDEQYKNYIEQKVIVDGCLNSLQ